ncbi:hypothetical protein OG21DRAFT_1490916 [Imleria badia]|nr:hypothetical protein OG21DRAFT_1490916 [Imleria badia]
MLLARSINPSAPTLFHAPLSPHAKSYKPPKTNPGRHDHVSSISSVISALDRYDTSPAKLIWTLTPQIQRLSSFGIQGVWKELYHQPWIEPGRSASLLPYDYNALEPYISEQIMKLHLTKHHQTYVTGLNAAEAKYVKATSPKEGIAL